MRDLTGLITTVLAFTREHIRPSYALFHLAFLGSSIVVNYAFDVESRMVHRYWGTPWLLLAYAGFYGVPLAITLVSYALWHKRRSIIASRHLLLLALWIVCSLATNGGFWGHEEIIRQIAVFPLQNWLTRCANNLLSFAIYCSWVASWWYLVDRRHMPFYGLRSESFRSVPFFLLLLSMVPLIIGASFLPDFLATYPRFRDPAPADFLGLPFVVPILGYELCYGLDFVSTELFFRGFMMFALGRIIGPAAIYPMVTLYVYLHFEKPLAEAISSLVGGYILGVVAWHTRSISAGIILHLGIAWMMEVAGWAQIFLRR